MSRSSRLFCGWLLLVAIAASSGILAPPGEWYAALAKPPLPLVLVAGHVDGRALPVALVGLPLAVILVGELAAPQTDAVRKFWMKNTQIPLDMLFFDSGGRLVNMIHAAVPFSLTRRNSAGPARYVLELTGGAAVKFDMRPDAQLLLPLTDR